MKQDNVLISVIIPIYNADKYLKQCLESVLNQSYKDIEICCIDDYSTDMSSKILEEYAKKDFRIKIIKNNKNIGVGLSRNKGIDLAKGKYLLFLDSDDWLETNAIQSLVKCINKYEELDIINYAYNDYDDKNKRNTHTTKIPKEYLNRIINIYDNSSSIDYMEFGMTKLINANFLKVNNIVFNDNKAIEDVQFFLNIITRARKILFINDVIFTYRHYIENSISANAYKFIEYYINNVKYADMISKNLPYSTRKHLMWKLYKMLINTSLKSFFYKIIDYKELQTTIQSNVEFNILKEIPQRHYITTYNDIINGSLIKLKTIYYIKFIIKENFPCAFSTYINLKNRLINFIK